MYLCGSNLPSNYDETPYHSLRLPDDNADDLCPSKLIINGTAERHTLSSGTLQINVSAERSLQMTALFVLQQCLLEVNVSLGHQHGNDPIVLDVSVAVEVTADGLAGLGQLNVEIVQDQHPGELSKIWIRDEYR